MYYLYRRDNYVISDFRLSKEEEAKIIEALNILRPFGPPERNFHNLLNSFDFLKLFMRLSYQKTFGESLISFVCGESSGITSQFLYQGECMKDNLTSAKSDCCAKMSKFWQEVPYAEMLASSVQDIHHEFFMKPRSKETKIALQPLIGECHLHHKKISLDCSNSFEVKPSLSGIVYSLNIPEIKNIFREKYIDGNIYEKMNSNLQSDHPLDIPDGAFTLSLILEPLSIHELLIDIHDKNSLPNFRAMPLFFPRGKENTVKLKPLVRDIDSNLRRMAPEQRNCLFKDEGKELKMFRNYSRNACVFECIRSKIKQNCNCLPWDYPRGPEDYNIQPCYGLNLECPKDVLKFTLEDECDCPLDCSSIKYSATIISRDWSASVDRCMNITPDSLNDKNVLLGSWKSFTSTIRTVEQSKLESAKEYEAVEACYYRDGIKLIISYEDYSAEKITKFGRVSFVGMLSNLGKK